MLRKILFTALLLTGLVAFPFVWREEIKRYYRPRIYTVSSAPPAPVAIVFGAAVYGNGRLSPILRDRMDTAIQLYESGLVQKLLVSGDNRTADYDEPGAMMGYASERGVPPEAIQPDYGGRRTYDTCYRARHIFQVESAILITQGFHLPRALFTCERLGLTVVGVAADARPYRDANWYELRETAATLVALWEVIRQLPPPVMGEPIGNW
ncbi:MAG: ElyC/SanA/YdcF family protein [Chloroflexota bacterium]